MTEQPPGTRPRRTARLAFAAEELRLMSALVVMLGVGLFLALPFVLSIGSVVFLPVATALVLMIVLAPLADRLARWGLPNVLASLFALLVFVAILVMALALILQPAVALFDSLPAMPQQVGPRFAEFQSQFGWLAAARRATASLFVCGWRPLGNSPHPARLDAAGRRFRSGGAKAGSPAAG